MKKNLWLIIILSLVVIALVIFWYFIIRPKTNPGQIGPSPSVSLKKSPAGTPKTSPTSTLSPLQQITIKLFMISQDDNGKNGKLIGCGDSVIAEEKQISPTEAVLNAAMTELLSIKTATYGSQNLQNPLSGSDLKVSSINLSEGKATIKLTGTLISSGTCEAPRIKAQLEETAWQFATVKEVVILINDQPLNEVLSVK